MIDVFGDFLQRKYEVDFEGSLDIELDYLREVIEIHPYIVATDDLNFLQTAFIQILVLRVFLLLRAV